MMSRAGAMLSVSVSIAPHNLKRFIIRSLRFYNFGVHYKMQVHRRFPTQMKIPRMSTRPIF